MGDMIRSCYRDFTSTMDRRELLRTGKRPLVGDVALLGEAHSSGTGTTYHVHILKRRIGYVVVREHLTIWQGQSSDYSATLCDDAAAVLRDLGGDEMMRADQSAWEEACKVDDGLAAIRAVEM